MKLADARQFGHAATLAGLIVAGAARAEVVADVELPHAMTLGGQRVVLASCGVRETWWLDLYAAALYLGPGQTVAAVTDPAQPKSILIHVILGALVPDRIPMKWRAPLNDGLEPDPLARVRAAYAGLTSGDRVVVAYEPGAGLSMAVNGRSIATAPGHALLDAMLRHWADGEPVAAKLSRLVLEHPC